MKNKVVLFILTLFFWGVFLFVLLLGLVSLADDGILALFFTLTGLLILPPIARVVARKTKLRLRFYYPIAFVLLFIAFIVWAFGTELTQEEFEEEIERVIPKELRLEVEGAKGGVSYKCGSTSRVEINGEELSIEDKNLLCKEQYPLEFEDGENVLNITFHGGGGKVYTEELVFVYDKTGIEERLKAEKLKEEEERLEREAREEEERLEIEAREEEEKLREEKEKAAEEERLEREAQEEEREFKANAITVTYDELLRHPEKYAYQEVYLKGEIVQSLGSNQYHINMTPTRFGYTDRVWVALFLEDDADLSLIENDIVEVWGSGMENRSYETALGSSSTVPYIFGYYANLITKAGER